jgi:hypothetical protein
LVSLKPVLRETETEVDWEARWDALARRVSDAWQSEKSEEMVSLAAAGGGRTAERHAVARELYRECFFPSGWLAICGGLRYN